MNQIEKNTVSAKDQLKPWRFIRFVNPEGKGRRILFAGNSITVHGIKPELGWHWEWGMAASCEENDYVHRVMAEINKREADAAFCIAQVSRWEVNYAKDYEAAIALHKEARDFDADVIIIRCVENCPRDVYEREQFIKSYTSLIDYLNKGNARVILTTSFWKNIIDDAIIQVGKERGYPVIYLGDLGELDEMKAVGQFEHKGVANHPNDNGMRQIAARILEYL